MGLFDALNKKKEDKALYKEAYAAAVAAEKKMKEYGYHGNGEAKNPIWPKLPSKEALLSASIEVCKRYMASGIDRDAQEELALVIENMPRGLDGEEIYCYFMVDRFSRLDHPGLIYPELAYYWAAYLMPQLSSFSNYYDEKYASYLNFVAEHLVVIGTLEQKKEAMRAMDAVAEFYCKPLERDGRERVVQYIELLTGKHRKDVFRTAQYDFSGIVNIDRANELAKRLITVMRVDKEQKTEEYAARLERVLGKRY